eukprot:727329-Prymnesium_polylepis.1
MTAAQPSFPLLDLERDLLQAVLGALTCPLPLLRIELTCRLLREIVRDGANVLVGGLWYRWLCADWPEVARLKGVLDYRRLYKSRAVLAASIDRPRPDVGTLQFVVELEVRQPTMAAMPELLKSRKRWWLEAPESSTAIVSAASATLDGAAAETSWPEGQLEYWLGLEHSSAAGLKFPLANLVRDAWPNAEPSVSACRAA